MKEEAARGSAKLGKLGPEMLTKAISVARDEYRLERWWWYGQPRIDLLRATLDVPSLEHAGTVIGDLLRQHGGDRQVTLDAFPYGLPPHPLGVKVNVRLDVRVGK